MSRSNRTERLETRKYLSTKGVDDRSKVTPSNFGPGLKSMLVE